MIYILWSMLNAIILLYCFYLLIGFIVIGRQVFHGKLKPVAIVVMTLGVFHIFSAFTNIPEEKSNEILLTENYNRLNPDDFKIYVLEENSAFDISLYVTFSEEDGELVPIKNQINLLGFMMGFKWKPLNFTTFENSKAGSDFLVEGNLEWNLFGFNIYNQEKKFTGQI